VGDPEGERVVQAADFCYRRVHDATAPVGRSEQQVADLHYGEYVIKHYNSAHTQKPYRRDLVEPDGVKGCPRLVLMPVPPVLLVRLGDVGVGVEERIGIDVAQLAQQVDVGVLQSLQRDYHG